MSSRQIITFPASFYENGRETTNFPNVYKIHLKSSQFFCNIVENNLIRSPCFEEIFSSQSSAIN